MKNISLTYLDSVGSWLDESNGNIFPAFDDGKIDLNNPISLVEDEVSLEGWHQSYGAGFWISPYDISIISFYFMKATSNSSDFEESTFSFQAGFPF